MAWVVGVVAVVGSNWFDGLCVCGSVDGLYLCVWGALCIEPVLEVEGEREEKKWLLESLGKLSLKKSDGWKEIIKKD